MTHKKFVASINKVGYAKHQSSIPKFKMYSLKFELLFNEKRRSEKQV